MSARTPSIVPASRLDVIARGSKLGAARELIRSAQIHDDRELLQALTNLHGSTSYVSDYTKQLLELLTDMDADIHYPEPEPEVLEYSGERAQLDSGTAGVRHRSAA